ncbi:MAG: hypothetical protein GC181_09705 [Bacteroidetes bacterium]|nr:hypothetical protein [Bacteroidota bacterium]
MNFRIIAVLLAVITGNALKGQVYSTQYDSGWISFNSFEVGEDSILIFGLDIYQGKVAEHRLVLNLCTKAKLIWSKEINIPNMYFTSTSNSRSSILIENYLYIGGVCEDSLHENQAGYILKFNLKEVDIADYSIYQFGYSTQIWGLTNLKNDEIGVCGVFKLTSNDDPIRSFQMSVNHELDSLRSYSWASDRYKSEGGSNVYPENLIEYEDGTVLSAQISARADGYKRDPILYKVNEQNKLDWTLELRNDTFSLFNFLLVPIDQNQFMGTAVTSYYKPYRNPEALHADWATINRATELRVFFIDSLGELISMHSIKEQLQPYFNHDIVDLELEHILQLQDGGYLIVGRSFYSETFGEQVGFMLKLNSKGEFVWYRKYQHHVCTPYSGGFEITRILGVTELSNGNIVLAGEYISAPSDSFPKGFQSGITFFTDQYGCLMEDCEKPSFINDSVQHYSNRTKVFPNPSSDGDIHISNSDSIKREFWLFDVKGALIHFGNYVHDTSFSIEVNGIYFLKTLNPESGETETFKVIRN